MAEAQVTLPKRPAQPTSAANWPTLPLAAWRDTYATLHMWMQIVGKTRLALSPMENHWWNVVLYVTARGLSTSPMPFGGDVLTINFDFIDHSLSIQKEDGSSKSMKLRAMSVADFYAEYLSTLNSLGIDIKIWPVPVEIETAIPFAKDTENRSYDSDAVHRWWQILVQTDRVLKRFRGRFLGKSSPVHFFWGSFDLALTRFSGRRAPVHPGGAPNCPDYVMVEAYSHECSSCGFWPGSGLITEPAFYAYAYPEPDGYRDAKVLPAGAYYHPEMREFILPYETVRTAPSPDQALLDFCQSTYEAAANTGHWDRPLLDRQPEAWP